MVDDLAAGRDVEPAREIAEMVLVVQRGDMPFHRRLGHGQMRGHMEPFIGQERADPAHKDHRRADLPAEARRDQPAEGFLREKAGKLVSRRILVIFLGRLRHAEAAVAQHDTAGLGRVQAA